MAPFYYESMYHPEPVKRLFDISVHQIAVNAVNIESLVGYPSQVGEHIFKQVASNGKLSESRRTYTEAVQIWNKFGEAYGDLLLPSLNLSRSLFLINEFLEPLQSLVQFVRQLDFSYCSLGPMHDLLFAVSHAKKLKKLSLRKNGLTDITVQKVTMPLRKFNSGPSELVELDLSGNPNITDRTVVLLSGFKNLQRLNLSGTSITVEGHKMLGDAGFYKCSKEECLITEIETEGWAKPIIQKWKNYIEERRKRKARPLGVYGMSRGHRLFQSSTPRPRRVVIAEEAPEVQMYFRRDDSSNWTNSSDMKENTSRVANVMPLKVEPVEQIGNTHVQSRVQPQLIETPA